MKDNFWWLFAAYAVIWLFVFVYVVRLQGRQAEMRRDLERLEREKGLS